MILSEALLFLRFTVGYPMIAVAGFVLGVVALGRLRTMTNGRRRLYRPLVMIAAGLCWLGLVGVLGVWQYGRFIVPLPVPMTVVSMAFSVGVLWIGFSLVALAVIVMLEEYQHTSNFGGSRNHG